MLFVIAESHGWFANREMGMGMKMGEQNGRRETGTPPSFWAIFLYRGCPERQYPRHSSGECAEARDDLWYELGGGAEERTHAVGNAHRERAPEAHTQGTNNRFRTTGLGSHPAEQT